MNRKNIPRLFLILSLAAYLINPGHLARATYEKTGNYLEEYLSTYNISFLINADLNNDGKEEKVTIYRQWDGENPDWSDDQWYILLISDHKGNVLYMKDISYFQEVGSFAVKDRDGDGLKEIIISLNANEHWSPKTYTYGWKGDGYEVVSEGRGEIEP
ncbi:MAG: hypothetical protein P9L93_02870 [Candidatus Gorgyraea atricola]|nr:hypothetical protein [Candidatus Gorgyraea atricola]